MDLHFVRRESVQQAIFNELQRYLIANRIQPGDRLPSVEVMARKLGVSRTAMREALHKLDAQGVLNIVNGRGVYVINPERVLIASADRRNDPDFIIDAIDIRWLLETEAAMQAIRRASDAQIDMLGRHVARLMERYRADKITRDEDRAFHAALYQISNNEVLPLVLSAVNRSISVLWEYPMEISRPFYDSAPLHEKLYLAIRARDEEQAKRICEISRQSMVDAIRAASRGQAKGRCTCTTRPTSPSVPM